MSDYSYDDDDDDEDDDDYYYCYCYYYYYYYDFCYFYCYYFDSPSSDYCLMTRSNDCDPDKNSASINKRRRNTAGCCDFCVRERSRALHLVTTRSRPSTCSKTALPALPR